MFILYWLFDKGQKTMYFINEGNPRQQTYATLLNLHFALFHNGKEYFLFQISGSPPKYNGFVSDPMPTHPPDLMKIRMKPLA